MAAKSGKAVTAVEPTAPEEAFAADEAKPGDVAKVKAKEQAAKSGKYGSTKAPAFKPADPDEVNEETEEVKTSWIEIELVGDDDKGISGEKYEITLPDGTMASGTLDGNGTARIEGFEAGECKVSFPKLDKEAWEPY
jgi:type VI secretion system secreted protein VgrG